MPSRHDPGRVPNEPFREAFLRAGEYMTASDVARHMGWMRTSLSRGKRIQVPDGTKAEKKLGLRSTKGGRGDVTTTKTIREDEAMKLLELFPSLDPVDVDV